MQLSPRDPPGRANRKLRGFVSEIARLRDQGHSIDAIRQALEDAGVIVGWATVQRELARLVEPSRPRTGTRVSLRPALPSTAGERLARAAGTESDLDGFFDQHNTNPLFKKKGSES